MIGVFYWCVSYSQRQSQCFSPVRDNEEMRETLPFHKQMGEKLAQTLAKNCLKNIKHSQWSKTISGIMKSPSHLNPLSWTQFLNLTKVPALIRGDF